MPVCVFVGVKQQNSTSEANVQNSSAVSAVKQRSSNEHKLPHVASTSPHDNRTLTNTDVPDPSSRPRPVRQSTGGRLMLARSYGTTPPRPGDEASADGGLPTETTGKHPARRASAPCNTSSIPPVGITLGRCYTITYSFLNRFPLIPRVNLSSSNIRCE